MRWLRGSLMLATVVAIVGLSALNWRAQLQTQQKLDAWAAALADRPAEAISAPQTLVAPPPTKPILELGAVPRELDRVTFPPYIIEAPDQLLIEVVVKAPKTGTLAPLPTQPLSGTFQVRPDGTVGLGFWGSASVTGLTLEQASAAIRGHLAKSAEKVPAENLVVVVDVVAYNSKRYYVIADSGSGEQVYAFPATGSETVLDAMSHINGLPEVASKRTIRISRRTSNPGQPWQTLPVDWVGITQHGVTATNYQILPGDRVYVTRAGD